MKKLKILAMILLVFMFGSCSDDFFDNEDPNGPTVTTPNFMMPNVIQQAQIMIATQAFLTTSITNQLAFNTNFGLTTVDNWVDFAWTPYAFQNQYWQVGTNNENMMRWAADEGSWHYVGAGQVIKALTFAYSVDFYGSVYFSEAFQGDIIQPRFDEGEDVYTELLDLLDDGIANLQRSDNTRSLAEGDILYDGDVSLWIKFAHAVKARLLLHYSKLPEFDPNAILAEIDASFTNTGEDAGFVYPGGFGQSNVWGGTDGFFIFTQSWDKFFIDLLNGDGLGDVPDPRRPIIAGPGSDGEWRGVIDGTTLDGLDPTLVSDLFSSYYTQDTNPYPFITFDELKFIEAEASFLSGNTGRAYPAYLAGVESNMQKLGVAQADIDAHLASAAIAQDAASLTLSDIMVQKYLALGFNPELWTDMRRHDYNDAIYPNLSQPTGANSAFGGEWIRRMVVFSTEFDYNPDEVERIGGNNADYPTTRVWWDIP